MTIRELVEQAREIATLPHLTPGHPRWMDGGRCCIGARLAHALGVEGGHYLGGVDEFARRLGGNRAQVNLMLRAAGAGDDPLDVNPWPNEVEDVWNRLARMEELPSLRGAGLDGLSLGGTDLSNSDLAGACLSRTNLDGARLSGANLNNADLTGASMRTADLSGADLSGADLTGAALVQADLYGADLGCANLINTDLTDVIIADGNTVGALFTGAITLGSSLDPHHMSAMERA